eukprot:6137972-Pyramimonas_sp.AAC.1
MFGPLHPNRPGDLGVIALARPRSFASPARATRSRNRNRFPGGALRSIATSPRNFRCKCEYRTVGGTKEGDLYSGPQHA